jgi:hypothetical protein
MYRRILYLSLAVIFGLMASANAATIIWVSEWMSDASGTPYDQGWIDLLRDQGYTVEADTTSDYMTLDEDKIARLEAADLVIISRNSNSGNYIEGDETTQWNSIQTPLLLMSSYLARSNRWQWLNGTSITEYDAKAMLRVVDTDHPVFKGITPVGDQVDVINEAVNSGQSTFIITTTVGNGSLIAQRADDDSVWIVEWQAGIPFYSGTTQKPAGKRMLFTAGGGGGQTAGSLNFNGNGKTMFLNAVRYMLGKAAITGRATILNPADKETDVPRDTALSWTPGMYAATHNVYFGTVFEDVNQGRANALVSPNQTSSVYKPAAALEFGKIYYWRVDEVNAPPTNSTIFKGDVWSFEVEPFAYSLTEANIKATASSNTANMGPEKTIDGSGLNSEDQHSTVATDMWLSGNDGTNPSWIKYEFDKDYKLREMWVWNSNQTTESSFGLGIRNATIEYSLDDSSWMRLDNVPDFNQAAGSDNYTHNTTIDFEDIIAKYVRITANSNWKNLLPIYGLSEVRFFYKPVRARKPQPASQATDVPIDTTLRWRAGREADLQEIYFSSDMEAVINGTALVGITGGKSTFVTPQRNQNSHDLSNLDLSQTYYWKINEVNETEVPDTWEGDLWSFTTTDFIVVDDFEQYDNDCNRIYYAWQDGLKYSEDPACGVSSYAGNGTGSVVGNNDSPFAEQTITHGGSQSMPFEYNNESAPYYSETQHQWSSPQDWTVAGAGNLMVYLRGDAPAFVEFSAGNILMNGTGTDIFGTSDQGRFVYKQLSGDGSIIARVESLTKTNSWAIAGVMIRESLNPSSRWAFVIYTSQNGARFRARLTPGADATSDTAVATPEQIAALAPVWIKLERSGNQFNGYYAMDEAGTAWTAMAWNPQTIDMASNAYIGLAVTSHTADTVCGARFSSVSTTGNVNGSWQSTDLGVAQSDEGNTLETFYVILEDSSGQSRLVNNPDKTAIATGDWVGWRIQLTDFTGVNMASIKKMYIGIGNKTAPAAGGSGKVYIDDIRLYPAPLQ